MLPHPLSDSDRERLIRRYVGKGTNLRLHSTDDLRAIEHRINTIPRRSLGWDTAAENLLDVYARAARDRRGQRRAPAPLSLAPLSLAAPA